MSGSQPLPSLKRFNRVLDRSEQLHDPFYFTIWGEGKGERERGKGQSKRKRGEEGEM